MSEGGVRPVSRGTRVLLSVFVVLTALATNQLFVLAEHTNQWFAWTIKPALTAAWLGGGYGAGFLLVVLALRTHAWAHARVPVVTVVVFTVLTLVATLLHRDRFHFGATGLVAQFAAWFWLAVYIVVPVALMLLAVRQERAPGDDPARRAPLPGWLAAVLTAQGVVLLVVGTALFVRPSTAGTLWPWTLTPLTARVVAAWLVAFGVAAVLALKERDLERLEIGAIAVDRVRPAAAARAGPLRRPGAVGLRGRDRLPRGAAQRRADRRGRVVCRGPRSTPAGGRWDSSGSSPSTLSRTSSTSPAHGKS